MALGLTVLVSMNRQNGLEETSIRRLVLHRGDVIVHEIPLIE